MQSLYQADIDFYFFIFKESNINICLNEKIILKKNKLYILKIINKQ